MIVDVRARSVKLSQLRFKYQITMVWWERWPVHTPVEVLQRNSELWTYRDG